MFTLLFIMMLISITVAWFLIQRLQERPWTQHGVLPGSQDQGGLTSSAPTVGLWSFMAVVTSVFLIFTASYFMRINSSHGGVAASAMLHEWVPVREPSILWLNTAVLIVTSLVLELARQAARNTNVRLVRTYLIAATVLTLIFLSGQAYAWQLVAPQEMTRSNAAYSFFVLLTAVHGLHLFGGLFVLTRGAGRLSQKFDATNLIAVAAMRQTVKLCATYWHFLLVVWFGLFTLLLST
jgi:cytochrome c oxidase subunit 3